MGRKPGKELLRWWQSLGAGTRYRRIRNSFFETRLVFTLLAFLCLFPFCSPVTFSTIQKYFSVVNMRREGKIIIIFLNALLS